MHKLLITYCSLLIGFTVTAQDFITDATMEETVMAADNELKILYFTATWCGPCRSMAPIVKAIDADPAVPVTIYKMDTDKNRTDDILNVRSIPTYYFMKNGRLLGSAMGAKSKDALLSLIKKHDAMPVKGSVLAYKGRTSKYKIIAGANQNLTVKNIETIWYNTQQLNSLSWKIYQQLTDKKDLLCALTMVDRSIELAAYPSNLETRAHILEKLGRNKEALKAAQTARNYALKGGEPTDIIETLITKLTK